MNEGTCNHTLVKEYEEFERVALRRRGSESRWHNFCLIEHEECRRDVGCHTRKYIERNRICSRIVNK
jgi:hypothetical protein